MAKGAHGSFGHGRHASSTRYGTALQSRYLIGLASGAIGQCGGARGAGAQNTHVRAWQLSKKKWRQSSAALREPPPRRRPGHCLAAQNRPSSTWPCACPWRDQTREAFVFSVWQNAGAYHCELLSPRPIAHRRRRLLRPAAAGLNRRGSLGLPPRNKRQFYARSVVVLHSKRWYVPPSAPAAQWLVPAPNSTRHQSARSRFPAL